MTKPNEKLVEFPRQSARDILTDVLRDGAQQMLATAIEAEVDDYLAGRAPRWPRPLWTRRADDTSSAMVICPLGRFKRHSGTCRCSSRGFGTTGPPMSRRRSGRRSCRPTCGRRPVWRPCIRGSISRASARETSATRSRRCWEQEHLGDRRGTLSEHAGKRLECVLGALAIPIVGGELL